MTDSFVPVGRVGGKVVIDLSTRRQALRDATARLDKRARVVSMNSPVTKMLKDTLKELDIAEGKRLETQRGKAMIINGLKLIHDHGGADMATNFLDEILAAREQRRSE